MNYKIKQIKDVENCEYAFRHYNRVKDKIDLKDYAAKFALCGLPVVKVAINFDTERRTLADWIIA